MAIIEVNDQSFQDETSSGTVLVIFGAPWCIPCQILDPILEEVDQELGGKIKIAKLNVDENPCITTKFVVISIPTLLIVKEARVVGEMEGLQSSKQIQKRISPLL